jgi:hypothetical protein
MRTTGWLAQRCQRPSCKVQTTSTTPPGVRRVTRSVLPWKSIGYTTWVSIICDMSYSNCDMPELSLRVRSVAPWAPSRAWARASMPRNAIAARTAMIASATSTSTSVNPAGAPRRDLRRVTTPAPRRWRW